MEGLRQSLHSHGYVRIPPKIFQLDPVTIQELRKEFDRLFHGHYETGIYPDEIHWRPALTKDNVTRELCNAWKASNVIAKIVCGEKLGQLAAALMGWSVVRIGQDDVLHKPPLSNAVGFHQDGAYISDNFVPSHDNCLTMWIALDDADQENGALQYAPGSHHWPYQSVGTVAESSFHFLNNENEKEPVVKRRCSYGTTEKCGGSSRKGSRRGDSLGRDSCSTSWTNGGPSSKFVAWQWTEHIQHTITKGFGSALN
ncbi:mitomycin antibiotics/polyketide fumonisin biosynthesis protein [Nitzschia inconspicua]|uniref:Mitomycin antibiotics/polyketide fumonisin biosynthesis protein n=1 Tax=Nitzschia inconspicua TaxID=303405 RepID=A0A9K3L0Z5_9STRA|nr:mitomycin antibiotics/polyketide fumonisin biosynthesis protein [Nitzschia inconspicua]